MTERAPPQQKRRRVRVAAQVVSAADNVFDLVAAPALEPEEHNSGDVHAHALAAATERAQHECAEAKAAVLAEDSSAFDYDGVYDEVSTAARERARQQAASEAAARERAKGERAKSRYIGVLQEAAARRNAFMEVARVRKLQREAEEDEKQHGKAERFVTEAYSEHLARNEEWEAQEREMERADAATTTSMSAFCAALLDEVAPDTAERAAPTKPQKQQQQQQTNKKEEQASRHRKHEEEEDEIDRAERAWKRRRREEEAARVAEQHAEAERQRLAEAEQRKQQEQQRLARRSDSRAISDARARYLARKAALAADIEAAKAKAEREAAEEMPPPE